jgi:hypothetical protein
MASTPVLYRLDVEQTHADEQKTIQELNSTFDVILERTAKDYGHAVRAVHAKAHGHSSRRTDGAWRPSNRARARIVRNSRNS